MRDIRISVLNTVANAFRIYPFGEISVIIYDVRYTSFEL